MSRDVRRGAADFPGQLGAMVLAGVDRAVDERWEAAQRRASRLKGSTAQRVSTARSIFARELAAAGAAAGAAAAAPVVGTAASLAVATAEIGWITARSADLILTIAAIHGYDLSDVEERRASILLVLAYGEAAGSMIQKLAGEAGKGLGRKAVTKLSMPVLRKINRAAGRTLVTKWGTRRGVVALGELVPFGIGAGIGGSANWMLARAVSRNANRFFADQMIPSEPEP